MGRTLSAAFTTLWYVLAVLLYGLIVIVPAALLVALVVKGLIWALRPRRPAPAVTSVEAPRSPEQK